MKITIEGSPEEVAALVLGLQERQAKEQPGKTIDEMVEELSRVGIEVVKLCSDHSIK